MRLKRLRVRNYRTLEDLDLEFPNYYTAISGRNDSGKTNVVRAIRCLMRDADPYGYMEPELSLNDDYTKWVDAGDDREMSIEVELTVFGNADAGLHQFIADYLSLEPAPDELSIEIRVRHRSAEPSQLVSAMVLGKEIDDSKAEQLLRKIQSERTILFHSSTDPSLGFRRRYPGVLQDVGAEFAMRVEQETKRVNNFLKRVAKAQTDDISRLLGRLTDRHNVEISLAKFDFEYMPYDLTLGDSKISVPLEGWGSGTKNRARILLTLLRAKQVSISTPSSQKITPVLVIEEPESFLHPSAQAEFGRLLQQLSSEFEVQIITTTHSPFLLSHLEQSANILLERKAHGRGRSLRATTRVPIDNENWMAPFSLALGISGDDMEPWKDLVFGDDEAILLVEGDVDRDYFELLRGDEHGINRLQFTGKIFPYGGKDNIKKETLLKFVKETYKRIYITYDLDAGPAVEEKLTSLGFERKKHFLPVGIAEAGRDSIEGLVPSRVKQAVYSENTSLVDALGSGDPSVRRSAKSNLKRLLLNRLKKEGSAGTEDFAEFYKLTKAINRALA